MLQRIPLASALRLAVIALACSTPWQAAWPRAAMAATTLVLQPGPEGKDAGVRASNPSTNYGADQWFYGIGIPGSNAGLVQFDVSTIPSNAMVQSAHIDLWGEYRDGQITLSRVAAAWDEMSLVWSSQPPLAVPADEVTYPISRGAPDGPCYWGCTLPFDVTDIVQTWVANPSQNFGLCVTANTGSIGWLMASSDNLSYPKPMLTVQYDLPTPTLKTSWGRLKTVHR